MGPHPDGLVAVTAGPDPAPAGRAGVIALWAHPRAVSTAFLRMMIARGDLTVVHEPLVTLYDEGSVPLPARDGGTVTAHDVGQVLAHLTGLGRHGAVFVKDTLEYRYAHLFDHPDEIAGFTHTFIVREPGRTISSHYAMKPTVTCPEIGFEHQYELFELCWRATGRRPVVVRAEQLVAEPERTVAAYCAATGLTYRPEALRWRPEDRPEWQRTRGWHTEAIASSGFARVDRSYDVTPDNDPRLRAFHDHHRPFYERLVAYAV